MGSGKRPHLAPRPPAPPELFLIVKLTHGHCTKTGDTEAAVTNRTASRKPCCSWKAHPSAFPPRVSTRLDSSQHSAESCLSVSPPPGGEGSTSGHARTGGSAPGGGGGSRGHRVGSALSRGLGSPHSSHFCPFSGLSSAGKSPSCLTTSLGGGGIQLQPQPRQDRTASYSHCHALNLVPGPSKPQLPLAPGVQRVLE